MTIDHDRQFFYHYVSNILSKVTLWWEKFENVLHFRTIMAVGDSRDTRFLSPQLLLATRIWTSCPIAFWGPSKQPWSPKQTLVIVCAGYYVRIINIPRKLKTIAEFGFPFGGNLEIAHMNFTHKMRHQLIISRESVDAISLAIWSYIPKPVTSTPSFSAWAWVGCRVECYAGLHGRQCWILWKHPFWVWVE